MENPKYREIDAAPEMKYRSSDRAMPAVLRKSNFGGDTGAVGNFMAHSPGDFNESLAATSYTLADATKMQ